MFGIWSFILFYLSFVLLFLFVSPISGDGLVIAEDRKEVVRSRFGAFGRAFGRHDNHPALRYKWARPARPMGKKAKKEAAPNIRSGPTNSPASQAKQDGRYLQLKFKGDTPTLDRVEFRFCSSWKPSYFQRGDEKSPLNWPDVESAFSLCFLGYVGWQLTQKPGPFLFGTELTHAGFAKQLSGAIYQTGHKIHELFYGENPKSQTNDPIVTHLVFPAIPGVSKSGRSKTKPLNIPVSERFLPVDCVQVFWDCRGTDALQKLDDFQALVRGIRQSLGLTTEESLLRTPSTPGPQQPIGDAPAASQPAAAILIHDPDAAKKSIQADLRAKMTRAQELHGRDEGKEAIALLEEVYHVARAHELKKEQLEAILNLGFATSARRDFKAVERRLREAEKLIPDVEGAWFQIQYKRLKARVLLHNKYPAPAENLLQKAIALGESDGKDKNIEQVGLLAHASYIHLLCEQKRAAEADEHVVRVRTIIEASNEDPDLGLIAELLEACIHWAAAKGDKEQASVFVKTALERGAGREAAICFGHSLHDCANGARGMKATDIALMCAEAAERLGHVAERPDMAFAAAYTAAAVLIDKEDFHAVRERCLRLLDVAKTLTEPKLRFCLFHLLSLASRQLGDKTTAVDAAETSLRDCEGDNTSVCMAKMALAEALRDSGRVKEALEHARTALQLSEHADVPPEWVEQNLVLITDCAARLGDWTIAESHADQLGRRSPSTQGSKDRRMLVENRIRMHKMLREGLTSVINATEPLSLARTEGAPSVQAANAVLVRGIIEGWKQYPNAAAAMYDYWGRGNFTRAMLNMRAFPSTLNITLEVHTVEEARRAIRLWGLVADVLVLIWKGPTVSSRVFCPVPDSFRNAGGGGYIAALIRGAPRDPKAANGMVMWEHDESADGTTPMIGVSHASLLPPEVGRFLCEEAVHLISLGRLIIVPATGIGCIGTGHGPVETLFAEACNAIPAIKGDAANFPASWLPYFHDIPLNALAHVVQEYDEPLRRLRMILMRKARQFRSSGVTGTESKELEFEIKDSLAEIADTQAGLRRKHGWGEAQEAVLSRHDGFGEDSVAPIFILQNMGYRWRIERATGDSLPELKMIPKENEPILTWLHPPDTKPKFITQDDMPSKQRKRK
jgi:tetratricopeptide (TPR) repeat protein